MNGTYRPTRRNRNIGTAKQGHGQNNRLVIPDSRADRIWKESLHPYQRIQRVLGDREIIFLVEHTNAGCIHACTPDDIREALAYLPPDDWEGLDTFVLRQPTRKQRIMSPVWGRLYYYADLGLPQRAAARSGPALVLEAVDCAQPIDWRTALDPQDQAELQRLRDDGHKIERIGRRHRVTVTPDSVRATQLYRTLLHEIGHWKDYQEKVLRPEAAGGDFSDLSDAYFARPRDEREGYAHRYADQMAARLFEKAAFPFKRIETLKRAI